MKNFFMENIIVTNIVNISVVNLKDGKQTHRNRPRFCIAFNEYGEKKYSFKDENPYTVSDNEFFLFPKYANYDVAEITPGSIYAINFEINDDDAFLHMHKTVKNSKVILNLFKEAEIFWRTKHAGYYQKCLSIIYEIIYQMKKEAYSEYVPGSKKLILSPAIEYIDNNYHKEIISVSHLAKLCNVSEVYFRTIFKSIYNTSPIKYINELKLTRAKELLIGEKISINEIAMMAGYNDTSTFSREFKKFTGMTPNMYRKTVYKNNPDDNLIK